MPDSALADRSEKGTRPRRFRLSVPAAEREVFRRTRWLLLNNLVQVAWLYYLLDNRRWALAGFFAVLHLANLWRLTRRAAGIDISTEPRDPASLDPRSAFWLDPGTALRQIFGRVGQRSRA